MRYFGSGEVVALSGLTPKQLRRWCETGVVAPARGGRGHGDKRRFAPAQVLAVAVAAAVRAGPVGCSPAFAREVVKALGVMSDGELLAAFASGSTHLALAVPVSLCAPGRGSGDDGPDVRAVYQRVAGYAAPGRRSRVGVGAKT